MVEKKSKKKVVANTPEATKEVMLEEVPEKQALKKQSKKKENVKAEKQKVKLPPEERKHSKKYRQASQLVDKSKIYDLKEAIVLVGKTSVTKFDSTIEVHIRLNVDPGSAEGQIRGNIVLPEGSGRVRRIAVLCGPEKEADVKKAGAKVVGGDDLIADIEKGKIEFDVLVATPDMMPKIGKLGRILGTKGLMPSPKSGTISSDPEKVVKELMAGRIEFKIDKNGIIHQAIGKSSFGPDKLEKNFEALLSAVKKAKPQTTKGTYILSISMTTTMGPGIKIKL